MAGFKVHFATAAVTGGIVATSLLSAAIINPSTMLLCFAAVILGGVLPDIDSDKSTVLSISFTILSLVLSFFIMFAQVEFLSILELCLLWFGVFLFFKLVVFGLFTLFTVHRGIFHSIPAAFLSWFGTTVFLHPLYNLDNRTVWIVGAFVFLGFIIHLLLDELTSLNLFGFGGVRQSFGSALKLYSPSLPATAILYLATAGLYMLTPESDGLFLQIADPNTWEKISQNFFPTGSWFAVKFGLWRWWTF